MNYSFCGNCNKQLAPREVAWHASVCPYKFGLNQTQIPNPYGGIVEPNPEPPNRPPPLNMENLVTKEEFEALQDRMHILEVQMTSLSEQLTAIQQGRSAMPMDTTPSPAAAASGSASTSARMPYSFPDYRNRNPDRPHTKTYIHPVSPKQDRGTVFDFENLRSCSKAVSLAQRGLDNVRYVSFKEVVPSCTTHFLWQEEERGTVYCFDNANALWEFPAEARLETKSPIFQLGGYAYQLGIRSNGANFEVGISANTQDKHIEIVILDCSSHGNDLGVTIPNDNVDLNTFSCVPNFVSKYLATSPDADANSCLFTWNGNLHFLVHFPTNPRALPRSRPIPSDSKNGKMNRGMGVAAPAEKQILSRGDFSG